MTERVVLLADAEQHELLKATLERVNRASNAARAAALAAGAHDARSVAPIVRAETEKAKLPATFNKPITERVVAALARRAGRQQKFTTYQSLTLPASAFRWPGTDRVNLPTASGRRTVRVHVDVSRGDLRPPLEGHPATLVYRNGELELVQAD